MLVNNTNNINPLFQELEQQANTPRISFKGGPCDSLSLSSKKIDSKKGKAAVTAFLAAVGLGVVSNNGKKDNFIKRFFNSIGNFFKKLFSKNSDKKPQDAASATPDKATEEQTKDTPQMTAAKALVPNRVAHEKIQKIIESNKTPEEKKEEIKKVLKEEKVEEKIIETNFQTLGKSQQDQIKTLTEIFPYLSKENIPKKAIQPEIPCIGLGGTSSSAPRSGIGYSNSKPFPITDINNSSSPVQKARSKINNVLANAADKTKLAKVSYTMIIDGEETANLILNSKDADIEKAINVGDTGLDESEGERFFITRNLADDSLTGFTISKKNDLNNPENVAKLRFFGALAPGLRETVSKSAGGAIGVKEITENDKYSHLSNYLTNLSIALSTKLAQNPALLSTNETEAKKQLANIQRMLAEAQIIETINSEKMLENKPAVDKLIENQINTILSLKDETTGYLVMDLAHKTTNLVTTPTEVQALVNESKNKVTKRLAQINVGLASKKCGGYGAKIDNFDPHDTCRVGDTYKPGEVWDAYQRREMFYNLVRDNYLDLDDKFFNYVDQINVDEAEANFKELWTDSAKDINNSATMETDKAVSVARSLYEQIKANCSLHSPGKISVKTDNQVQINEPNQLTTVEEVEEAFCTIINSKGLASRNGVWKYLASVKTKSGILADFTTTTWLYNDYRASATLRKPLMGINQYFLARLFHDLHERLDPNHTTTWIKRGADATTQNRRRLHNVVTMIDNIIGSNQGGVDGGLFSDLATLDPFKQDEVAKQVLDLLDKYKDEDSPPQIHVRINNLNQTVTLPNDSTLGVPLLISQVQDMSSSNDATALFNKKSKLSLELQTEDTLAHYFNNALLLNIQRKACSSSTPSPHYEVKTAEGLVKIIKKLQKLKTSNEDGSPNNFLTECAEIVTKANQTPPEIKQNEFVKLGIRAIQAAEQTYKFCSTVCEFTIPDTSQWRSQLMQLSTLLVALQQAKLVDHMIKNDPLLQKMPSSTKEQKLAQRYAALQTRAIIQTTSHSAQEVIAKVTKTATLEQITEASSREDKLRVINKLDPDNMLTESDKLLIMALTHQDGTRLTCEDALKQTGTFKKAIADFTEAVGGSEYYTKFFEDPINYAIDTPLYSASRRRRPISVEGAAKKIKKKSLAAALFAYTLTRP